METPTAPNSFEDARKRVADLTAHALKELQHVHAINRDLMAAMATAAADRTELAQYRKAIALALEELDDRADVTGDSTGDNQVPNFEASLANTIRQALGRWAP
jgi:protein-tyrosine-phosphatase